jgi:peptidoglycan/LPS O-acetylase OafA/YrhL
MPTLVFLSHATIWTGSIPQLRVFFMAGGLAVDVFIFISGFLMMWHYLDREKKEPWNQPVSWRNFWIRRFFRMAPLYWVILTSVYVFHRDLSSWIDEFHSLYPPPWMNRVTAAAGVDSGVGWANVLSHYTFMFGFFPKYASNNPLPDWSIGLEMQFYLAFPFLALAIKRFGWVVASIALVAVWLVAMNRIQIGLLSTEGAWGWFPMPTFLPLRIGIFLCGMLAAGACHHPSEGRRFLLFFASSAAIALWHNKWLVVPVSAFYIWEWICRTDSASHGRIRVVDLGNAILKNRAIGFIADCSYGVYLWHIPIQLCTMRLLQSEGWFVNTQPVERFCLLTAIALPLVYGFAWLTFRLIERPGINLGKRLLTKSVKSKSMVDLEVGS